MDARNEAAGNISTFEPSSDLIQEEDCNTLLLYLPGFTKDQLRVQLTRTRVLKISGARPLGSDKTSSFQKDFPVPESCDTGKITAKFEDGILYVRQPKIMQTQPPKIDPPTPIRTTDHQIKPAAPIIAPKPPLPATQLGEQNNNNKPAEEDKKKKQPPPVQEEDKKKQQPPPVQEEDKKKQPAGQDKTAKMEDHKKKQDKTAAKVEADYSRLSPAARLKAVKDKMTNVVLLLFVFALGIYVTKLPWFSNRAHH